MTSACDDTQLAPIAYLMTHFPAVSHTFIADEIRALEDRGTRVIPFSINSPREVDEKSVAGSGWSARTTYLKQMPRHRMLARFVGTVLRHPSVLLIAARSGGFDLRAHVWRVFHLVEATVLADGMRRHGCRHVHAHFGQTPATVAWFATEVGNRTRRRGEPTLTWSTTIHGWHEFANVDAANLRQKVAAATFIVCISDFTRSQLLRIAAPADWPKLHVVRCGIDLDKFTTRQPRPVARASSPATRTRTT